MMGNSPHSEHVRESLNSSRTSLPDCIRPGAASMLMGCQVVLGPSAPGPSCCPHRAAHRPWSQKPAGRPSPLHRQNKYLQDLFDNSIYYKIFSGYLMISFFFIATTESDETKYQKNSLMTEANNLELRVRWTPSM